MNTNSRKSHLHQMFLNDPRCRVYIQKPMKKPFKSNVFLKVCNAQPLPRRSPLNHICFQMIPNWDPIHKSLCKGPLYQITF